MHTCTYIHVKAFVILIHLVSELCYSHLPSLVRKMSSETFPMTTSYPFSAPFLCKKNNRTDVVHTSIMCIPIYSIIPVHQFVLQIAYTCIHACMYRWAHLYMSVRTPVHACCANQAISCKRACVLSMKVMVQIYIHMHTYNIFTACVRLPHFHFHLLSRKRIKGMQLHPCMHS